MTVRSSLLYPFLGLIKLVWLQQSDDSIDLHKLFLFFRQVLVGGKLLLDTITKLFPVEVPNQLFELILVHDEVAPKCVHIEFN